MSYWMLIRIALLGNSKKVQRCRTSSEHDDKWAYNVGSNSNEKVITCQYSDSLLRVKNSIHEEI